MPLRIYLHIGIMNCKTKRRLELFLEGKTIGEIAEITKDTYSAIKHTKIDYKYLLPENLFKYRFKVNDDFFDNIDSEIKAYLLGFFLADGCIDGSIGKGKNKTNRITINQSMDDLEVVKMFEKYICLESEIKYKNSQLGAKFRKPQCYLRWTSEHMTKTLEEKYNIHERKSHFNDFIFPFENIPKEMYRHFIRGFFDGDGSVDFAKTITLNGIETTRFQYSFICNSSLFAKQLGDIICKITDGVKSTIRQINGKTTNWWVLRFNTSRIRSLEKRFAFYEYLYKDSEFYLSRKKQKFDSFFEYRANAINNIIEQCNA